MSPIDPPPAASADAPAAAHALLHRPASQRHQEFKYRFGQAVVFGLPVVSLQAFGRSLGGPEADRWVTALQALLAGWVVYVAASGMVAEGALLFLHRRLPRDLLADLVVGLSAIALYLAGNVRLVALLAARPTRFPATFHWAVVLLALWCGIRWTAKKGSAGTSGRAS